MIPVPVGGKRVHRFGYIAVAPFWTDQGTPRNYAQDFSNAVKNAARVTKFLELTNTTSISAEDMSQRLAAWLEAVLE